MILTFDGEIWFWRGPAPWYFVTVPEGPCHDLRAVAGLVSYGWGMIPVRLRVGGSETTTSLWPKDGGYIVPLKADLRRAERLDEGDIVTVRLEIALDDVRFVEEEP